MSFTTCFRSIKQPGHLNRGCCCRQRLGSDPVDGDRLQVLESEVPGRFGAVFPFGLDKPEQSVSGHVLRYGRDSGEKPKNGFTLSSCPEPLSDPDRPDLTGWRGPRCSCWPQAGGCRRGAEGTAARRPLDLQGDRKWTHVHIRQTGRVRVVMGFSQ